MISPLKIWRGLLDLTGAKGWLLAIGIGLPILGFSALLLSTPACEPSKLRSQNNAQVIQIFAGDELRGTIGEVEVRVEMARKRFEREGTLHAAPLPAALKSAVLERLIARKILALEAEKLGVRASTTAVARELDRIRYSLSESQLERKLIETYQTEQELAQLITDRLTVGKLVARAHEGITVTPAELQTAWDNLPAEEKERKPRVRASQIVVKTEEEGTKLVAELKKGANFEEMAKKHSIGPEGIRGGDLGWFEKGVMPKIIEDVCFALKVDQLSPLTPSEYGFHVFKVTAVEAAAPKTFEDAKKALESKLLLEKLERAEADYVERIRSQYRVVKDDARIAAIE